MHLFVIQPFQGRIDKVAFRGSRKLDSRLLGFGPFRADFVGCHPRIDSCHHYAVRYGIIADRGLSPTAGVQSLLRSSKRLPCNN